MKELDYIDISRTERAQSVKHRRRRRRRRFKRQRWIQFAVMLLGLLFIFLFCFLLYQFLTGAFWAENVNSVFNSQRREFLRANETQKPVMEENFLTPNPYSRPGNELEEVNNIFVHYTANQGTSAAQNRSYFENLGITGETSASAHFVIGYDGEIIQCLPLDEIGYAVKQRNYDSISIECCYLSADGKFTQATYDSLIHLCGWLLKEYKLTPEEVLRHYDEGGKKCPLYYVENEEEWDQFLTDLEKYILNEQV